MVCAALVRLAPRAGVYDRYTCDMIDRGRRRLATVWFLFTKHKHVVHTHYIAQWLVENGTGTERKQNGMER